MKIACNRYAIVPRLCYTCKLYILFEPYRRYLVWNDSINQFGKENVCRQCLHKYMKMPAKENKEEK